MSGTGERSHARRVTKRTRIAHHEAGHAVLSAAIADAPHLVSIRIASDSLGRARYRLEGCLEKRVQIHLAGFAAEDLVCGRRSRQFVGSDLSLSIAALTQPANSFLAEGLETCDQYLAVRDIVLMGVARSDKAIREGIERFYSVARDSLAAVWPQVASVARALLRHTEIDYAAFRAALGSGDIYSPVFLVQHEHGLMELSDEILARLRAESLAR
jgi:hypothetical protein